MASNPSAALAVRDKVQKFLEAARAGNVDLMKKLAKQLGEGGKQLGKTVSDVKDANKRTALHFAAREGKINVCKYLIEELGLEVDIKDEEGETPLIHACRQEQLETVRYLLDRGADPSASSDLGATSLHHSAGTGNIELLNLFLAKGVNVNSHCDSGTPLIWAAGHDQVEAVKVLLNHQANPNARTDDDITPLLSAVAAGSVSCLKLLIESGAEVNIMAGGATPLHIAADIGNSDLISILVKAGANPNAEDEEGFKPIQTAVLRSNLEAVTILFPLTAPIEKIKDWTVEGVMNFMQPDLRSEEGKSKTEEKESPVALMDPAKITPEAKRKSSEAKSRGDEAFRRKDYQGAIDAYTQAIDLDPSEGILLSNRSLCWIRMGQADHALADAKACRKLRPDWPKACYREGTALRLLQRFDEAANAFYEGVLLDPENMELVSAFREAVEEGRKFHGTTNLQK
ncbi:ankyrin repeat family protein [Wolffia australiana]